MSGSATVRLGGRSPRAAAATLHRVIEGLQKLDRPPKPTRRQRALIRAQFATLVTATHELAPKIVAAINTARAPFWERLGLREASERDDELERYLAAAEALDASALEAALRDAYEHMAEQGIAHVRIEVDDDFALRPDRAIAALDAYGAEFAAGVIETEREALKRLIRDAFEEGVDVKALAGEIADHFVEGVHRVDADGADRTIDLDAWAQLVARTETARAQNAGALAGYEAAGVERVIWVTAQDERVCPVCNALNGRTAEVGQNFEGTDVRCGPAHPSCRCGIVGLNALTQSLVQDDEAA